jgi:hypothetical protein
LSWCILCRCFLWHIITRPRPAGQSGDVTGSQKGADFRATKDIDMVLIVEALSANFGFRFWEYVKAAGYEHRSKRTGAPEFYRFTDPIEDDVSSLSAILLDDEYYGLLKTGVVRIDGIPVSDAIHLIP